MKLWRDAAAPMADKWKEAAAKTGIDTDAALADLRDTLKKYDSLLGE